MAGSYSSMMPGMPFPAPAAAAGFGMGMGGSYMEPYSQQSSSRSAQVQQQ
jgi:hypothetical protein